MSSKQGGGKEQKNTLPRFPAAPGFLLSKAEAGLCGYDPARVEKNEEFLLCHSSFTLGLTSSFQKNLQ